jgi:copper chaperone
MNQTFQVTGMTCGHCEKAVTARHPSSLTRKPKLKIDRSQNTVHVAVRQQPREALARAIAEEGYASVTPLIPLS